MRFDNDKVILSQQEVKDTGFEPEFDIDPAEVEDKLGQYKLELCMYGKLLGDPQIDEASMQVMRQNALRTLNRQDVMRSVDMKIVTDSLLAINGLERMLESHGDIE